jgi:hypothetical protein
MRHARATRIPPAPRSVPAVDGAHPATRDKSRAFDHHTPPRRLQERAILYGATEIATCVAEVFQATRTIVCVDRAPQREPQADEVRSS